MDRPKDKTPHAEPARAVPLVRSVLGAADVAAYLRQNPDFLVEHSELLQILTPPSQQRGERIVDMQQFMLQHLRAEIVKLKSQHRALITSSRANLASQARVHAAALFVARCVERDHAVVDVVDERVEIGRAALVGARQGVKPPVGRSMERRAIARRRDGTFRRLPELPESSAGRENLVARHIEP